MKKMMSETRWYQFFFDRLYLVKWSSYLTEERTKEETSFVLRRLQERNILPPARVLDAGCGTGRHSFVLARKGYTVVGIDASPYMIAVARQSAYDLFNPQFYCADLLDWKASETFDAVLSLFSSFGYLCSNELDHFLLARLCAMVSKTGLLILDLFPAERGSMAFGQNHWNRDIEGNLWVTESHWDARTCTAREKSWVFSPYGYLLATKSFQVHFYTSETIASWLAESGFQWTIYGDYNDAIFTPESPRMIFVACRR